MPASLRCIFSPTTSPNRHSLFCVDYRHEVSAPAVSSRTPNGGWAGGGFPSKSAYAVVDLALAVINLGLDQWAA